MDRQSAINMQHENLHAFFMIFEAYIIIINEEYVKQVGCKFLEGVFPFHTNVYMVL